MLKGQLREPIKRREKAKNDKIKIKKRKGEVHYGWNFTGNTRKINEYGK